MSKSSHVVRTGMGLLPMALLLFSAFAAGGVNADHPANLMLTSAVLTSVVKAPPPCPNTEATDKAIEKAIQEKLKAHPVFKEQITHINANSNGQAVTLEGWVTGDKQVKDLIALVKKTDCVKKVITTARVNGQKLILLKPERSGSCGPGLKDCCDGCILSSSRCLCNQ